MFSSFAGVYFAVKSKSTVKCLLLTRKMLSKIRKTVYGKNVAAFHPAPPSCSLSLSCTAPSPPPRHVFITGRSSGIGLALAHQATSDDARVSILARSISKLEEVKQAIRLSTRIDVAVFAANVRDYDAVSKAINETEPIDVLIVNQGVFIPQELEKQGLDEVWFMMDVNLMGTFHMIKSALPSIKKRSHCRFRFFFFFLPDLRFGFDFCQFWVASDGCRCADGLLVMGVGDLAGCGVACRGGGGFVGWLVEVVVGFLSIPVVLGCVLLLLFFLR